MATYLSQELAGVSTGIATAPTEPAWRPRASVFGGRLKRLRATIQCAGQLSGDVFTLGVIPQGGVFAFGVLTTDTSLGSSTIAIGNSGSTGKYRTAAVFTATDTPTLFGNTAAVSEDEAGATSEETVIATVAAATLPASAATFVVDIYYSQV